MNSEEDFDKFLLALFQAKDTERVQSLINKYLVQILKALENPQLSKFAIPAINEMLGYIKSQKEIKMPLNSLLELLFQSKNLLVKNVTMIWIKLAKPGVIRIKKEPPFLFSSSSLIARE